MKKICSIALILIICNVSSLIVANKNQCDKRFEQTIHYICQQSSISNYDGSDNHIIAQTPNDSATVIGRVNSIEGNTFASTASNEKSAIQNTQNRHLAKVIATFITHQTPLLSYTRTIDHYIYEMRHIII